jgi:hypothetical protein
VSDVLQCPYCDLRFSTRSELEQHKTFDHPREQEEVPRAEPAHAPVTSEEREEQTADPARKRGFLSRLFNRS